LRCRQSSCVISQRYSKMKAIHNTPFRSVFTTQVVLYLKDTQKWKQFTTLAVLRQIGVTLCYISKILKNESNSQRGGMSPVMISGCVISQRYSKMKAIHNDGPHLPQSNWVVLYLKDTQKWKQFTTYSRGFAYLKLLCYISKILKNESNSQLKTVSTDKYQSCVISQRYSKMKAIHNLRQRRLIYSYVVLYLKDTQKWKQFTTSFHSSYNSKLLCYISKILKNESNSQPESTKEICGCSCVISQRYSKMKAIHN